MTMVYGGKTKRSTPSLTGAVFWRGLLLGVMALTWTACASALHTSVSRQPQAAPLPEAVVALVNERNADPQNPAKTEAVVKAALEARHFTLAFDEAQRLRELQPDSDKPLALLGAACFGLGLFDQAAASYYAANQKVFSASRAYSIGWILVSKGAHEKARAYLSEALLQAPHEWLLVELLLASHTSPAGKIGEIEDFLARNPEHPKATQALAELQRAERLALDKIVRGEGQVIRVPLSESYEIPIKFDDFSIKTHLTMGDALVLSAPAMVRLGLKPSAEVQSSGSALGERRNAARTVIIKSVKIGELSLENVSATVMDASYTDEVSASIGIGRLLGYSIMMDRKARSLEFHPHTLPLPKPSERTKMLQGYKYGSSWLVEVATTNLNTKRSTRGLGSLQFGYQYTLFDAPSVSRLGLGTLDTTQTVTMVSNAGYGKTVAVERMALQFAGDTFLGTIASGSMRGSSKQDFFLATDLGQREGFVPYVMLGRDVLHHYKLLLDTQSHTMYLEAYE